MGKGILQMFWTKVKNNVYYHAMPLNMMTATTAMTVIALLYASKRFVECV